MDIKEVKPYTRTVIVATNWILNLEKLFEILPITSYTVLPKKRGRKRKDNPPILEQNLKRGSIITLKLLDKVRGINIKGTKSFRNCLSIVMYIDKFVNFKIPKRGKIQFTGCKDISHARKSMQYLYNYIQKLDSTILTLSEGKVPILIFNEVMINIRFDLGFTLNRERLDSFLNEKTSKFYSFVENSLGYAGATITFPIDVPTDYRLLRYRYIKGKWYFKFIDFEEYLNLLPSKDILKERKKLNEKKVTFLVFDSGTVILSSPFLSVIPSVYKEFVLTLKTNKEAFIENISNN